MRKIVLLKTLALLSAGWRRRYLIVIPILLMPVIGFLVGVASPKKYESYTTILIQEAAKQNPFLKDLTVETNLRDRMAALQALLHSRHILGAVAQKIGMIDENSSGEDVQRKIGELSASLKASLVGNDLVKISYTAKDPSRMEEILRLVSVRFVERIIAPQRSSIMNSESFLSNELSQRDVDLENAEQRLAEYKSKFASELPELHASNVVRLGRLRDSLAQRKTELEGAKAAQKELQTRIFKTNPVIGRIEERIVEVVSELTILRSRYTDSHTKVQAALRKLRSLEDERSKTLKASKALNLEDIERLWNMASNQVSETSIGQQPLLISQLERLQENESRVSNLEKQVESLETEIASLQEKVEGFGVHEQRLAALTRETAVKRKIYQDLAERHQLARVTGSLGKAEEKERVKLIDPPFTPMAPTNLPIVVFIIMGFIGGCGLGIALAFVSEVLDLTVRTRRELETLTNAPVLTRIPLLPDADLMPEGDGTRLVFCPDTAVFIPAENYNG